MGTTIVFHSHLSPNQNDILLINQTTTTDAHQMNNLIIPCAKYTNKNPQVLTYSWEEGPM